MKWRVEWRFLKIIGKIAPCDRIRRLLFHLLHTHASERIGACRSLFHISTEVYSFIPSNGEESWAELLSANSLKAKPFFFMEIPVSSTITIQGSSMEASLPYPLLKKLQNLFHDRYRSIHQEESERLAMAFFLKNRSNLSMMFKPQALGHLQCCPTTFHHENITLLTSSFTRMISTHWSSQPS